VLASFLVWFGFELDELPVTKSDIDSVFGMDDVLVVVSAIVVLL
jgi:hypothetical protein